jgi:hypothetical protein
MASLRKPLSWTITPVQWSINSKLLILSWSGKAGEGSKQRVTLVQESTLRRKWFSGRKTMISLNTERARSPRVQELCDCLNRERWRMVPAFAFITVLSPFCIFMSLSSCLAECFLTDSLASSCSCFWGQAVRTNPHLSWTHLDLCWSLVFAHALSSELFAYLQFFITLSLSYSSKYLDESESKA